MHFCTVYTNVCNRRHTYTHKNACICVNFVHMGSIYLPFYTLSYLYIYKIRYLRTPTHHKPWAHHRRREPTHSKGRASHLRGGTPLHSFPNARHLVLYGHRNLEPLQNFFLDMNAHNRRKEVLFFGLFERVKGASDAADTEG